MIKDYSYLDEFGYEKCKIYGECNPGEFFQCHFCDNYGVDEDEI